jgi:hypothetical protein
MYERAIFLLREMFRQLRLLLRPLLLLSVFCLLLLAGALILAEIEGIPAAHMTRDALQTLQGRCYIGFISSAGILLWMSAATACLLAWAVLRRHPASKDAGGFYLCFGVLTLMMALDDQFLFHEKMWPFFTGLPQCAISGFYAVSTAVLIFRFRSVISKSPWILWGLSLLALGMSAALDVEIPNQYHNSFVEDSFKLFGIALWTFYSVRCAVSALSSRFDEAVL